MKRKIKFRGQRIDTNEWVYGYYVEDFKGGHRIYWQPFEDATTCHLVKENSIGQFTGIRDMGGKEIYEGDKVVYTLNHDGSQKEMKAEIEWHKHSWRLDRIWLLTEIRNIKIVDDVS